MKQPQQKTSSKNNKKQPKESFIRRHPVWVIIGIVLVIPVVLFAVGLALAIKEKGDFRAIKQDMLTLQERLNAADGGGWEYREGCSRFYYGWFDGGGSCGLGLGIVYENVSQQEVDLVVSKTNKLLKEKTSDLFKPGDGKGYAMSPPVLAEINFPGDDELRDEGTTGSGVKFGSARFGNSIECSFQYNLSAPKPGPAKTGTLDINFSCSGSTNRTYFPRTDVDIDSPDHKAESPL